MHDYLGEWCGRKCSRRQLSIREARAARFKHYACLGPRGQFGVVHLRGEPSIAFGFQSLVNWPDSRSEMYDTAVLDGILDELFASDLGHVVAKIHFTLEEIEWHDVDSSAIAFYHAARGAVREILGLDSYKNYNVELPHSRRE